MTDEQYLHGDAEPDESPSTTKYADAASGGPLPAAEGQTGTDALPVALAASETPSEAGESIWSGPFWRGAGERAVKTFAQTEVTLIGANLLPVVELPWYALLGSGLTAAILSVLTSLINPRFTAGE